MSVPFEIPDWLLDTSVSQAPRDTSDVDPHRVEDLVNGKQEALFTAPDAYYRTGGRDAVDGAPAILDRLNGLKQATLDAANDDGMRFVLAPHLDAHLDDASDGIDRHVAAQRDALIRQIISERQNLIQRAAQLEHNNDNKLAGLAEAHASAAQELARMNGEPEAAAMDAARSTIWRTAIDQHLASGNGPQAITLFDQVKNQLAPDDHLSLDEPLQVVRSDQTANQWIANWTGTDGSPLQDRAVADPNLPPDAKLLVRAKLDARDSAQESGRVAKVKALDDQIADVTRTLAATPGNYKTGTLFGLARAYDEAGEPDKAVAIRRLATQEAVLVPFARMSVDKQQRFIDSLPEGELRDTAAAIQRQQTEAFARDPFAAGTKLYDDVGPPLPIDDIRGRLLQARQIEEMRGGIPVMPFTGSEIADMRQARASGSEADRHTVLTRLAAVPQKMRPVIEPVVYPPQTAEHVGSNGYYRFFPFIGPDGQPIVPPSPEDANRSAGATQTEPDPGSPEYQAADAEARRIAAEQSRATAQLPQSADEPAPMPSWTGGADSFGGAPQSEPAPGSPEYQAADAEAHRIVAEQEKLDAAPSGSRPNSNAPVRGSALYRAITGRMISQWASNAPPGTQMPRELVDRLNPDETQEIGNLASGNAATTSDPAVLAEIINGLKSRNPQTQRQWAQAPLYRYKAQLSRDDFAKAVALQQDLDPESGGSRAELAAIRKQLAARPDTSDLDWAYKALEGDPGVHYFQYFMIGVDRNGKIRLWVLPEVARSLLRGGLDLLKGTKTGELTPEAIETFAGLTGVTGGVFGPLADGATFGAGGARWLKMGGTPDKFSLTGREVVERMRAEGLILGEGPLLRGNPNQLRLVTEDGQSVLIGSNVDMAHKIAAVTWWNRIGRTYGARATEVRRFMLDPDNYVLQPNSINRSIGARLRETYQEPVPPDPTTPKR